MIDALISILVCVLGLLCLGVLARLVVSDLHGYRHMEREQHRDYLRWGR